MATDCRTQIAAILPAHNEEFSIASVIEELKTDPQICVIVVDDNSSDRTALVSAQAGADFVIRTRSDLGAWGATQTGLRLGLELGKNLFVTLDADGQHPGSHIKDLVAPVLQEDADLSIGSYSARATRAQRLIWTITRALSGLNYEDMTSGFKCYSERAAKASVADSMAAFDFQDVGVLASLKKDGFRGVEIPVTMRGRAHGSSRVFDSWKVVIYYVLCACLVAVTKRKW